MLDKELKRVEAMVINRALDSGGNRLTMIALTDVVRLLSVADAQRLCGFYGLADLSIADAVLALSAKLMMRFEGSTPERPRVFAGITEGV